MGLYSGSIIHRTYNMKNDHDFIFGLRPVIEAINSGRQIDKLLVKRGLKGELYHELLVLLKEHGLSYQAVPAERLDRVTKKNHQGVIAWLSSIEFQKIISDNQSP